MKRPMPFGKDIQKFDYDEVSIAFLTLRTQIDGLYFSTDSNFCNAKEYLLGANGSYSL